MNRAFFGTLIAHAKSELAPINTLLVRASNDFLTEQSIDRAIFHLQKTQEHLIKAKQSYVKDLPPLQGHLELRLHPLQAPHTKSHLS
jgi:hypothetical protein